MKSLNKVFDREATVCLVAILRDEARFLNEWLLYHKLIGIDHFFLYDDDIVKDLASYLEVHKEFVTVVDWQRGSDVSVKNQLLAYQHASEQLIRDFDWVIFLDADEFIVLKGHVLVQDFLSEFPAGESAVSLNWHVFGHNGHFDDPEGLITSSLTRRMKQPSRNVKTFTRTDKIATINSPHFCKLADGIHVDVNHHRNVDLLYPNKSDKAHVNHYQSRSFRRWMHRVERGDVNFSEGSCPDNQAWRLTSDRCLRKFVTNVALDKNEFVDVYMLRYRDVLNLQIENLQLSSGGLKATGSDLKQQIEDKLHIICKILTRSSRQIDRLGLDGKIGISLFLFHYSLYFKDTKSREEARNLIQGDDSLLKLKDLDYSSGCAGIHAALDYMTKYNFIKCEHYDFERVAEVFLTAIDKKGLEYYLKNNFSTCLYLLNRMAEYDSTLVSLFANIPSRFISLSSDGVYDLLAVMSYILERQTSPLNDGSEEIYSVDYFVSRINTFKLNIEWPSVSVLFAWNLLRAFEVTSERVYEQRAFEVLKGYENRFRTLVLTSRGEHFSHLLLYEALMKRFNRASQLGDFFSDELDRSLTAMDFSDKVSKNSNLLHLVFTGLISFSLLDRNHIGCYPIFYPLFYTHYMPFNKAFKKQC